LPCRTQRRAGNNAVRPDGFRHRRLDWNRPAGLAAGPGMAACVARVEVEGENGHDDIVFGVRSQTQSFLAAG